MKFYLLPLLLLSASTPLVVAQDAVPSPAAEVPGAVPEVQPSPASQPGDVQPTPEAVQPVGTPEPSPTPVPSPAPPPPTPPTTEEILKNLSAADLQEALNLLKANYIHPEALTDEELSRALFSGLITRLKPGVQIQSAPSTTTTSGTVYPFLAEMLDERIGYVRPGELSKENIGQLDTALDQFNTKKLGAVILDLRATPPGNNLEAAVEVIKRFVPKGRLLFTVRKPSEKQERIFTSNQDPKFQGLVMILVDEETAGSAEIIAAAVRSGSKSMVLGSQTAGQSVEYEDRQLSGGRVLRVAVAEVVVSDTKPIFPEGLTPDLVVELSPAKRDEIFRISKDKGVSQFVFDKERPRMNEAALLAGTYPELDAYQAELAAGATSGPIPRDPVLQRAVDLITTISIYESKK